MDSAEPLPLSAFCYPNENLDHPNGAPLSAGRSPFLWSRLPRPNRTRLLRALSRLVERRLQATTSRPTEVTSDELHELDVPKPIADGERAIVGHAI